MNKTFRIVWSAVRNAYVVTHEKTCSCGKPSSTRQAAATLLMSGLLAGSSWALAAPPVNTLPTGGQIVGGATAGTIATSGSAMTVTQNQQRMIANWESYSIGQSASVHYQQPTGGVALNRVAGSQPSEIYGRLTATGDIYLINSNGVMFGRSAQVDVGSLVATTMKMDDGDFMAGHLKFAGGNGSVVNLGKLTAEQGGYIALLAPEVRNEGVITASLGSVVLGGAEAVTLSHDGTGLQYAVDKGAVQALVDNRGLVQADGGQVLLSARAANQLASAAINNSGTVEARGLVAKNGRIVLEASGEETGNIFQSGSISAGERIELKATQLAFNTGRLSAGDGVAGGAISITGKHVIDSGTLDASGSQTGGTITIAASISAEQASAGLMKVDGGNAAGSIKLTAGESAYLSGQFSANAEAGNGGEIALTASNLTLAGARLHADGGNTGDGGTLKIGGGWQGGDTALANANTTYVSADTQLSANAGKVGTGGTAVVWSEQRTDFAGKIEAKGGSVSGDGGQVEVSSHDTLAYAGTVNASATHGAKGKLLLDPKNINIETSVAVGFTVSSFLPSSASTDNYWGYLASSTPLELPNGNFIISGQNNACGTMCGELRLFSSTGSLIATFTGSNAYDRVGSPAQGAEVKILSNNNVIMLNRFWGAGSYGSYAGMGAITWFNGSTGALNSGSIGGAIGSTNSLVGSNAGNNTSYYYGDQLGAGSARELTNGNVVVGSPFYGLANNTQTYKGYGALTWLDGSTGEFYGAINGGTISDTNSMLGSWDTMRLGSSLSSPYSLALANGNFVYSDSGATVGGNANTGIALWMNGSTGSVGTPAAGTEFFTGHAGGANLRAVALSDGNFVLSSSAWNSNAGYVYWVDGSTGLTANGYAGTTNWSISSSTALVGDATYSYVGNMILALDGGRYAVSGNKSVTFVDPSQAVNLTGTVGTGVSFTYTTVNGTGAPNLTKLSNGNFVATNVTAVVSPYGQLEDGVVTWFDGTNGHAKGESSRNVTASTSNSLYGGSTNSAFSRAGSDGITELTNGNFIVQSSQWNGFLGAATWCSGSSGCSGAISSSNSLVGGSNYDYVGQRVTVLNNGNYVVRSQSWSTSKGAVTWGNGTTGTTGTVSSANSLVGSSNYDYVGQYVTALSNGNYVAFTQDWHNGSTAGVGAATWVDGSNGHLANWTSGNIGGTVSATNSLIGASANDRLAYVGQGSPGVLALSNGNYVVTTPYSFSGKGSATWGNGSTGIVGTIAAGNSFLGRETSDGLAGNGTATAVALADGNYVIGTRNAKSVDQLLNNAGAVTWFNGSNGYAMNETSVGAALSATNSYFGTTANQYVGDIIRALTVGSHAGGFVVAQPAATISGYAYSGRVDWYKPSAAGALTGDVLFASNASADNAFTATQLKGILDAGTNLTLQANNDITLNTDLIVDNASGNGGSLTLQAGRHITFNGNVTTDDGNLTAIAGDAGGNATYRDAGTPTLTIASGKTINVGTGTATLVANGGNFINNAGSGAIVTSGAGRYFVYSADPLTTTEGLSGYNKHYAQSYGGAAPAYASSGNWFLYSVAPEINVTPGSATMTYGDATPAFGATYASGFIDGDTTGSAGISGTAAFTVGGSSSTGGRYTYGSHNVAYSSGLLSSLGYAFADNAGSTNELTVNKRDLNLAGLSVAGKTYDGTNVATITGTASVSQLSGDLVSLNGSVTGGTFASIHAGTHAVTVTGLSGITGADSGNYNFISSFSATISPRTLIPTLTNTGVTKVYDGSTSSSLTPTWSYSGLVAGDTAASLAYTGRDYNSKDVATANAVSVSGLSISGITGSNGSLTSDYVLDATSKNVVGTITAKSLTVSGLAASSKIYDATANVSITNWGSVTTGVGSETLVLNHGTASFSDANAATGKTVTASGYSLADGTNGGLAGNYQLSSTSATTTANITAKTLTLSAAKTYDGTASLLGYVTLGGFVGSETLTYTAATASNSHVATAGKYVSAITLANGSNGGLVGNYQLPTLNVANAPVTIIAATLTPTISNTGVTKVYDGDTSATLTPTYTFAGLVAGDTAATLTNTGRAYNSKDVATASTITVNGLAISGITGSNGSQTTDYVLDATSKSVAATITRKDVSVTSLQVADKVYDGTANATSVQSTVLSGVIAADSANVNTAGTLSDFSSKNVGTYSVSVTGMSLTGSAAGNYNLTSSTATDSSVAITAKTLTLSASKTYDGTTGLLGDVTLGGFIGSETLTYTGATASSSHVATAGKYVNAITLADGLNGGVTGNYQLPTLNAANAPVTITAATLTPTLTNTGVTKAYDGSTSSSLTPTWSFSGLVSGDTAASLAYTGRDYNSKDVATANTVTVSGLSISGITGGNGSAASDYVLDAASKNVAGTITAKTLTVSGLAAGNRGYDATTNVTITNWGSVTTGVGSETLVLNHGTASFADKNAATGKTVTAIDYSLADGSNGGLASNYQLSSTSATTTANITARTVTLSGGMAVDKTYDGRASMPVGSDGYGSLVGIVGGDTVTVTGAPAYDSAHAGARVVQQGTVAIAGTDAANYTLSWTNGSGTINKAPLTVTANADAKFVTQADAAGYYGVSYSGFVNGETTSALNIAGLTISRSNSGQNGAGTYTGVLVPSGVTAANYQINYAAGDYTIVPANQLLVRVQNTSTTYGTSATYTITDARYMDGGNVIHTLAAPGQSGNTFTYSDGVGGSAAFTLGPVAPQSSSSGQIKAGSYSIAASAVTETSANFSDNLVVVGGLTVAQKALTANAGNVTKVYDGTTSMNNVVLGYIGLVSGDQVSIGGNGSFSDKNVGIGKTYTVSSLVLGDADAANYYLAGGDSFSGNNGEVTRKTVSLNATRTYDGTRTLDSSALTITTGVGSETLTFSGTTAASKNVGAGNYVDAITLLDGTNGGLASNYQLPGLTSANAGNGVSITAKTLTLSSLSAADKTYDGTTSATVTAGNLVGLVGSETLALNTIGAFSDPNVGVGKTVFVQLALADGTGLASNYTISDATTAANINPVPNVVPPLPPSVPTTPPAPPSVPDPTPPLDPNAGSGGTAGGSGSGSGGTTGTGGDSGSGGTTGSGGGTSSGGDTSGGSGGGTSSGGDTPGGSGSGSGGTTGTGGDSGSGGTTGSGGGTSSGGDTSGGSGGGTSSGGDTSGGSGSGSGGTTGTGGDSGSGGTTGGGGGTSSGGDTSGGSGSGSGGTTGSGSGSSSGSETSGGSGSTSDGDASGVSGSGGATGSRASSENTQSDQGITVTVVKQPGEAITGVIVVEVPRALVRSASGFSFSLPKELVDLVEGTQSRPEATLADGGPLPLWLRFIPESNLFVAKDVPATGLPIQILIKIGATRTLLMISERDD